MRRRRRRGVALIESLIAISMMIVMFAGVVYFQKTYTAKARVMREARLQAWLATDASCPSGGQGHASELAPVPQPFARNGPTALPVQGTAAMRCNERHDPRTTPSGVLQWSGLSDKLGSFSDMLLSVFDF